MTARIGRRFTLRGHPEVVGERATHGTGVSRGGNASADTWRLSDGRWRTSEPPWTSDAPRYTHREFAERAACLSLLTEEERAQLQGPIRSRAYNRDWGKTLTLLAESERRDREVSDG